MTWADAYAMLAGFRSLQPDWDGEGGEPPSVATIDNAAAYARWCESAGMEPPARVVVGVNADILLEWWTETGGYRESVIFADVVTVR